MFEVTVTNRGGLQSTDSCTILVDDMSPVLTDLRVSSIRVELQRKGPNYEAKAFVTVVGESFSLIREAIVTGIGP